MDALVTHSGGGKKGDQGAAQAACVVGAASWVLVAGDYLQKSVKRPAEAEEHGGKSGEARKAGHLQRLLLPMLTRVLELLPLLLPGPILTLR